MRSTGAVTGPTPYAELNGLLDELVTHSQATFGAGLVGVYLVGSFALGGADDQSDCDFLVVVTQPPSGEREAAVRALWAELPTRPGTHWHHDLEGSYAVASDLADNATIGRPWLFVDHGHTTLDLDQHCNHEVARWTLHQHGVTLVGPQPGSFVAAVTPDLVRDRSRRDLATLLRDILAWAPTGTAWTQRYLVTTYCRVLYSLVNGEVATKRGALEWAMDELDPRWRPLLAQVRDDRSLGWVLDEPPRPGSLDAAYAFATYAEQWAGDR